MIKYKKKINFCKTNFYEIKKNSNFANINKKNKIQ